MQKPYISHCSGAAGRTGEGALKALKTLEKTKENVHIWSMDRLVQAGPGPAPFTKGIFRHGTAFPVDSRFSTRARARAARPGQTGWAGLAGQAGLGRAARPGWAGSLQAAVPARLPALCETRLPVTLRDLASQDSVRSGLPGLCETCQDSVRSGFPGLCGIWLPRIL